MSYNQYRKANDNRNVDDAAKIRDVNHTDSGVHFDLARVESGAQERVEALRLFAQKERERLLAREELRRIKEEERLQQKRKDLEQKKARTSYRNNIPSGRPRTTVASAFNCFMGVRLTTMQFRADYSKTDIVLTEDSDDDVTTGDERWIRPMFPLSKARRPERPLGIATADSVTLAAFEGQPRLKSEDVESSTVPTAPDSLGTSIQSVETEATPFSRDKRFTAEQIQNATRTFVSILQEDEVLIPLYESARTNIRIGPNRLRRHIRGGIKAFAERLKEEANNYLQFAASRLVSAKARYAARCIAGGEVRGYRTEASGKHRDHTINDFEESSEDERAERPADITHLGDLKAFRLFLTGSDAYTTLRAEIQAFCTKDSEPPSSKPIIDTPKLTTPTQTIGKRPWHVLRDGVRNLARSLLLGFYWTYLARSALSFLANVVFPLTDDLLIVMGYLEPPLKTGWTRIRSECVGLLYE